MPLAAIVDLIQALVRIPSRAGEDDLGDVCRCVERWLRSRGLDVEVLDDGSGRPLGVYAEVRGDGPGPWTVLDATLDTAAFGDRAAWRADPLSAHVDDGWLHGRGSGDSKAGAALFAHLLTELHERRAFGGRIGLLLDCDEHSGRFGGARAFFDRPRGGGPPPRPEAVLIGYPGMDRIVNGSRGFVRCGVVLHGVAAHSGSSRQRGVNAISRAARLVHALEASAASAPAPAPDDDFPLPPQLTVTGIEGGSPGYTQVPDRCALRVDLRLTPSFDDRRARALVGDAVAQADAARGDAPATEVAWQSGWPAYRVPPSDPMVAAMRAACRGRLGTEMPLALAGPSNIGNYLASLGIPALCGFGVRAEGVHAANERIALDSIAPVHDIYRAALLDRHRR